MFRFFKSTCPFVSITSSSVIIAFGFSILISTFRPPNGLLIDDDIDDRDDVDDDNGEDDVEDDHDTNAVDADDFHPDDSPDGENALTPPLDAEANTKLTAAVESFILMAIISKL